MLGITLEVDEKSVEDASKKISKAEKKTSQPTRQATPTPQASGLAGIGKGILSMLGKILVPLLGIFAIWKGLEPILSPMIKLVSAIMMLLFMPLIPLFQPILKLLGQMAKELAPIMSEIKDKVSSAMEEGGIVGGLEVLIDEVMPILVKGFEKLMKDVIPKLIPLLIAGFIAFIEGLIIALPDIIKAMVIGFKELTGNLVSALTSNWKKTLLYFLSGLLTLVLAGIVAAITGLTGGWALAIGALLFSIFVGIANWLEERFPIWLNKIKNAWDSFVNMLKSVIRSIVDKVKGIIDKIPFVGSDRNSRSVDDALITSDGKLIEFNQNDNILAFQGEMPQAGNQSSITINVQGFVGDEDDLAEKVSRALNLNRGGSNVF